MNNIYDYRESNLVIFGLHGVDSNGNCECGNPECKALYKHPRATNWQSTPFYSDEQVEVMVQIGHLATGFGVLVKDIIVVDVDARNGGLESYKQLCIDLDIDLEDVSGFVVETGSADGSMHIYFKSPIPPVAMAQALPQYKGVDFKSSGYVVGEGSMHRSGNRYETKKGYPQDINEPPQKLIDILQKKSQFRSTDNNGQTVDIEDEELRKMVMSIGGGSDYYKWRDIGLALHHTTQGALSGLAIWDEWSQKFDNYDQTSVAYQWGKMIDDSVALVSLGTIIHYAKQDGYIEPVTFNADEYIKDIPAPIQSSLLDQAQFVDIRRPPKFAGILCQWINNQCRYPRENLAAAATLYILSCVGGMRHYDAMDSMSLNFMPFGVAGSASGKESIFQAIADCLAAVDLMPAVHGSFKSEQEAVRNLLRHQASFYLIDELGIELKKITQSQNSYLSGMIGFFMKVYSKAEGTMPVSGDLKEDIKEKIKLDLQRVYKLMDKDGEEKHKEKEQELMQQLNAADKGIIKPYFNLFGLTTPVTFDGLVDHEMATNGFIARSPIFREHETNPKRKKGFKSEPLPMALQLCLSQLYSGGNTYTGRVQAQGERVAITTEQDAAELLDEVDEYFYNMAEEHKSKSGLEAICRRGWEICSKVSLIVAMPSGSRTVEDVLYGFAVAKWDIQKKIELAFGNEAMNHKESRAEALMVKIKSLLDHESGTSYGTICNRLREFSKDDVKSALKILCDAKQVLLIESTHPVNKKVSVKFKLL